MRGVRQEQIWWASVCVVAQLLRRWLADTRARFRAWRFARQPVLPPAPPSREEQPDPYRTPGESAHVPEDVPASPEPLTRGLDPKQALASLAHGERLLSAYTLAREREERERQAKEASALALHAQRVARERAIDAFVNDPALAVEWNIARGDRALADALAYLQAWPALPFRQLTRHPFGYLVSVMDPGAVIAPSGRVLTIEDFTRALRWHFLHEGPLASDRLDLGRVLWACEARVKA